MSIGNIPVIIHRRKFHVILVVQSVARVSAVVVNHQLEAHAVVGNAELVVRRLPILPVNILHVDLQLGTILLGQIVKISVPQPVFPGRRSEPVRVLVPISVEIDRTVVSLLDGGPALLAVR
jgi:hypothetical protein